MRNRLLALSLLASIAIAGCGSDDSFALAPAPNNQPNPPAPENFLLKEFVITPNVNSNNITVRSINLSTGQTQLVGNPVAVGTLPTMVRVHPTLNAFYVTNTNSNTISAFRINSDGQVTPVPGSPFAGPTGPRNIHIHPGGTHLYVGGDSQLRTYVINSETCAITPVGNVPIPVPPRNEGGFSNNGRFLHIPASNGIVTYPIDKFAIPQPLIAAFGVPGAATVNDLAISPDGSFLLANIQVTGANNDRVVPYTIASDGSLTIQPINQLNFEVGLGDFARNGTYYVGDLTDANSRVFGFSVSNVGLLTPLTGSPFSSPGGGSQAVVDKTDQFVFSAAQVQNISVNKRQADNTLQLAPGSPITDNSSGPFIFDFFTVRVPQ